LFPFVCFKKTDSRTAPQADSQAVGLNFIAGCIAEKGQEVVLNGGLLDKCIEQKEAGTCYQQDNEKSGNKEVLFFFFYVEKYTKKLLSDLRNIRECRLCVKSQRF